jgi:hypothetical protein
MTLLNTLIEIPEHDHKRNFAVRLTLCRNRSQKRLWKITWSGGGWTLLRRRIEMQTWFRARNPRFDASGKVRLGRANDEKQREIRKKLPVKSQSRPSSSAPTVHFRLMAFELLSSWG